MPTPQGVIHLSRVDALFGLGVMQPDPLGPSDTQPAMKRERLAMAPGNTSAPLSFHPEAWQHLPNPKWSDSYTLLGAGHVWLFRKASHCAFVSCPVRMDRSMSVVACGAPPPSTPVQAALAIPFTSMMRSPTWTFSWRESRLLPCRDA